MINNNQGLRFNQYVYSAKEKNSREIWYQDVPIVEAEQLKVDEERPEECAVRKIIKFFTSSDKKSYLKYEYESDGQGTVSSTLMGKYSYAIEIENVDEMYNAHFMEQCFLDVLSRFLANE